MRHVDAFQVDVLLTLSLALGGYALAQVWHLSGPLEAVAAAIALRRFNLSHPAKLVAHERVDDFWKMVDEVQNGVLFVLLGLEVSGHPVSVAIASLRRHRRLLLSLRFAWPWWRGAVWHSLVGARHGTAPCWC